MKYDNDDSPKTIQNPSYMLQQINVTPVKLPCNVRCAWEIQGALSENRAQVDDIKLAFKFLLPNFDKIDPN